MAEKQMKIWQKPISLVATLALLLNSLVTPVSVLAQEVTPTPTEAPTPTPIETPIPVPSIIPTPAGAITPAPSATPTVLNQNPEVTTNKSDYFPDETVLITGINFPAGKTDSINITSQDNPPVNFTDTVTADDKGKISYSYTLDGNYRPNYKVEIKDGEIVIASTSFTDTRRATTTTPTHISPANGIYLTTANLTLIDWTDVSDPNFYKYESSNTNTVNSHGKFISPVFESGALHTSEIPASGTPEGIYYWHVQAKSNHKLTSNWSTPWKITVDNTAPTVPTLSSPANNTFLTTHDFTFYWNASTDSSPITYEWESSYSDSLKPDGSFLTQLAGHTNLSTSVYSPGTPDGAYYWHVRAVDAAGNKSGWSTIWKVTVDTTPPTIPTVLGFINPNLSCGASTNIKNVTVDWTDSTDINGAAGYDYNIDFPLSPGPGRGVWNAFFVTSQYSGSLNEGIHYIKVRAKDSLGNISAWSNICSITYDTTPPTVDLVFPTPGPSATSFQAVFSEDVNAAEATDPANYFLHNWPGAGGSGDLTGHATIAYNSTTHTATITFTSLGWYISPEQNYGVQNIHDLAGNLLAVTPYSEYSTPLIAPVTTDNTDANWHTTPFTVNLTCTDTAGSGCKNTYYTTDGTTPTTSSSSGNSVILNTDGVYTIKYFSTDNAGNTESVKTAANNVKIDVTAPTGSWVTPVASSTISGTATLSFTASDATSGLLSTVFQYKRDDGVDTFHTTRSSWDTTGLPLDNYILRAVVTDNAGNTANFDEKVGVAAVVSNENSVGTGFTSALITWTTDRPTTSRVVYDTIPHPVLGSDTNYGYAFSTVEDSTKVTSHSVTITGLAPGTTYYYRTISHGSPIAIGGNNTFNTLSIAGAPAPSGGAGSSVLGINTVASAFPQIAFSNADSTIKEVLGASTTATPAPTPTPIKPSGTPLATTTEGQRLNKWLLAVPFGLIILGYIIYRKSRKNS